MGQTLTNGVYLPDNGERNCYTGLSQNWQKLDNLIGSHGDSVSFSQTLTEGVEIGKITINGTEISMYHTDYSGKADASNVYTKTEIDTSLSSKANASDLTTHTSNADIHVTSTDKTTWNGKQSALSTAQLNACNSGITSTKVSGYDTHVANSDVHVTTSDKSTWNAKQNALTDTQLSACNSGITSDKVATYDGYASTKVNKAGDTMTGSLIAPSFVANNIDCSVDSQGDGWIRYSNGLQICFEKMTNMNYEGVSGASYRQYPKSFNINPYITCSIENENCAGSIYSNYISKNNTKFMIRNKDGSGLSDSVAFCYIAIGTWK